MLESIINEILGDKPESASDENKKLRELLESALDENKKLVDQLEFNRKEVDSYKKMNVERRERYSDLRKLYDKEKIEKDRYYQQSLKLSEENNELRKEKEHYAELERWKKNTRECNLNSVWFLFY